MAAVVAKNSQASNCFFAPLLQEISLSLYRVLHFNVSNYILKRAKLNKHRKTALKTEIGTNLKCNYVFSFLFTGEVNISKFAFTEWTTNFEITQ